MTIARFAPTWITSGTQPLDNSPVHEGSLISFTIQAVDEAQAVIPAAPTLTMTFSSVPGTISAVFVNDVAVPQGSFSVSGRTLSVQTSGLSGSVTVRARRDSIAYRVLTGEMPPGLELTAEGEITGTLRNVPASVSSYSFTIRASNDRLSSDRTFTIRVVPETTHKTFVFSSFPPSATSSINR